MLLKTASDHLAEANQNLERGFTEQAADSYRQAIALDPGHAESHLLLGKCLSKLKRYDAALACYATACQLDDTQAEFHFSRANALKHLRQFDQAIEAYDQVIQIDPQHAKAYFNRGIVMQLSGRAALALGNYDQAIRLNPQYAEAYNNRGNLRKSQGQPHAALEDYDRAIALAPLPETHYNRGIVLQQLGRLTEALAAYDMAITLNPHHADAHNNRGSVLQSLGRLAEAAQAFDQAIAIRRDYPEAWNNLGNLFKEMKKYAEALGCYRETLRIKPDFADAWANTGITLQKLNRLQEAIASYDKAIELNPAHAEAWFSRGNALKELKQLDEAVASYAHALAIKPDYPEAFGSWLQTKMHTCDWQGIEEAFQQVDQWVLSGAPVVPFNILATPASAAIQKRCAENFAKDKIPAAARLTGPDTRYAHDRIRLGYFSADLHNHATAYLMAELFEKHDKSCFELIAFSFGPNEEDEMRQRIRAAFDQFHEVRKHSDEEIAKLAHTLEIDIAIDLKGYTRGARPKALATRPAPLQVNYLGYPGTMGADFIDYLIADPIVVPAEARQHYTEKIAYVPDTYQVNDRCRIVASREQTRAEHDLPDDAFVFCCFNNNFKITPDVFHIWMHLLHTVENSVLWLFEANPSAMRHMLGEAARHDIAPQRLVFAKKKPQAEHLARYRLADLVIDTFHYNAHTTTSDALWVGTPVLTCIGSTFAGRVAASLLTAHGVPELITHSPEAYQARAIELASNPETLAQIRNKVAAHRDSHPLFDTTRFTRNIENVYQAIYQRHQRGLPPDHITLES